MDNLQKSARQTFLCAFILLSVLFSQTAPGQNADKLSPGDKPALELPDKNINYNLPFKKCWTAPLKNIFIVYASDNEEKLNVNVNNENVSENQLNELFVSTIDGKIISLNTSFGTKKWETDLGGEIVSPFYVTEKYIYVVTKPVTAAASSKNDVLLDKETTAALTIRSIYRDTGITRWQSRLPSEYKAEPESEFLYVFNSNLILLDATGRITAFDKNGGQILWNKETNYAFSTKPFFAGDKIILQKSADGRLLVISIQNGAVSQIITVPDNPTAFYYNKETGKLIFGSRRGIVYALDANFLRDGKSKIQKKPEWQFHTGAQISDMSITRKGLLVSSLDNFVYLISEDFGDLIWKKRLAGRISAKPFIADKYAVLTTVAEPSAVVIDLETGKFGNKIFLGEENFFIGSPLSVDGKLILTTQNGIFAFSNRDCPRE